MSEPVGKRIPPATLIDAPFLQQHFPNAPESVRAEWLTAIQRQAVYSLGDLEFISEQTWKDIGLPGLTRDKLQVLSGWRQPRHQQASAVSPRRSHAPATSSKDRSSDAAHRSPQRTNKSTQKHSDDRDRSRHSPQRHARDVGDGAKSRERDRGREHHAEKGHSNSPSSASGAKHASHSASSAADAHHSRPAKSTSPQRSPRGEPRAESRSHSKHSGGSGGSGSRDKKQAPPTSASAPALPLVPPSLGTPPPPPPKDDEVPDWSDSSSSGDEAPKPPAAPDITLLDVVVPASAKPSASGTAVASAARPVDPAKPKPGMPRPVDRPASPLTAANSAASPPAAASPLLSRPAPGWFAARESTDAGGAQRGSGPGSSVVLRNSGSSVAAAGGARNSGAGVPAIIGRRADNAGAVSGGSEGPKKPTGSGIVRPQGEQKPTITKEERLKRLGHVRSELFATEKVYVTDLTSMRDVYYTPLQQQKLLTDALLNTIFTNTQSLLALSKVLLDDITKCMDSGQGFGACFIRMSEFMKMYSQYCSNYDAAVAALAQETRTNPRLADFLKRQSLVKGVPTLESLLIKPIQRLCRYPLLLREMLKQMEPTEVDFGTVEHACTALDAVVSKVNDSKRQFETMQRVQRFRKRLVNGHYIDFNAPGRQHVRDGTLRIVKTAKQKDVTVWLFSDLLVVCRPAKMPDGQPDPEQLKLKASPPLHLAFVAEIPDGTIPEVSGAFSVSWEAMDGRNEKLTFYTWPEDRVLWVNDLSKCIDERRRAKSDEKKPAAAKSPAVRALSPAMRERPPPASAEQGERGPGIRRSSSLQTFKGL